MSVIPHEAALSGIHMDMVTLEQQVTHARRCGDDEEEIGRVEARIADLRDSRRVLHGAEALRLAVEDFLASCTSESDNYVGGVAREKMEVALRAMRGTEDGTRKTE